MSEVTVLDLLIVGAYLLGMLLMILCGAQLFCFGLLSHQINSVRYAIGRDDR